MGANPSSRLLEQETFSPPGQKTDPVIRTNPYSQEGKINVSKGPQVHHGATATYSAPIVPTRVVEAETMPLRVEYLINQFPESVLA